MIVYDLLCEDGGHRFEGWFGSSGDFSSQQERGLIACPQCASGRVSKAVMAPRLTRKGNQQSSLPSTTKPANAAVALTPQAQQALAALAALQTEALKTSRWVGKGFAESARAMHYGDAPTEAIHGQATLQQARDLVDEGVEIAPVIFPLAQPDELN